MQTFAQTRWTLADLLEAPQGAPLENALKEIEERTARFEAARPKLHPQIDAEEFLDLVKELEDLLRLLHRLSAYAELWFTQDTQNQNALAFMTRMEQLSAEVNNRVLFFSLWWKGLDDADAARLLNVAGDYRYFLETERRFKPHTLSEAEEKVINLKDVNGIHTVLTLYDMITSRYKFTLQVDGETKTLTRDELMQYVVHPSAEVRAAAYREQFRVFANDGAILSQIYASRVNDWKAEQVLLRHHKSAMGARNLMNDLPDAAVDTMLEVCRENAPLFQHYFRLKGQWLGLEPMRRSDIYAPLSSVDVRYTWSEAVNLVLDSLEQFSPLLAREARMVFEAQHIDSEIRPGKRSGAFCASILPELVPWVMINYTGRPRDVATLAHELGHAIHARLAKDHSLFTFHSTLPLAETASVFAEMILNERLLQQTNDHAVKRDILARMVDDAYATVMRQAFFALFEREAHTAIVDGATMDDLCRLYFENLKMQFGNAVELQEDFRWEWLAIPHFYQVPFYVYAYSFGQLLTLALYQRYREEGESFKPKYFKILAYGGSASPEHILREAGIDFTTPEFWQGGFDVIRGFIHQLEQTFHV